MALNIAPQIVRERRRQLVASILATQPRVTQRQICAWLAADDPRRDEFTGETSGKPRAYNPHTGKPFSLATINGDVKFLRKEYAAKTAQDRDEWAARLLLIYEDLLTLAQRKSNVTQILAICAAIRKMNGIDAPTRTEVTGADGAAIAIAQKPDLTKLTDEELDSLAAITRRLHGD